MKRRKRTKTVIFDYIENRSYNKCGLSVCLCVHVDVILRIYSAFHLQFYDVANVHRIYASSKSIRFIFFSSFICILMDTMTKAWYHRECELFPSFMSDHIQTANFLFTTFEWLWRKASVSLFCFISRIKISKLWPHK